MNALPGVVQIASSYPPNVGGVETLAHQVARRYRDRGGAMTVVTNRWPMDLPADETLDGVPVHRLGLPLPGGSVRSTARWALDTRTTRRRVAAVVDDAGPALIHVQCLGPNAYYALRAARATGLPLVASLHGELSMDDTGAYRLAAMRRAWREVLTAAAVVTGCSQAVVDEAVAAYGPGLTGRVRVLPNAVDTAAVAGAPRAERQRPFVLAAARLVPQKGIDLLVAAFAGLAAAHPDLELVVVGDGPQRDPLIAQAARLGLAGRVSLPGAVPAAEVHSLMRSARVFVLPSRLEPQGLVLLEAMAAGAPVVASAVGGVPETVQDGVTGLLAQPTAPALAAAITAVLDDPAAAAERVERARDAVARRSWDGYVDALTGCYRAASARRVP